MTFRNDRGDMKACLFIKDRMPEDLPSHQTFSQPAIFQALMYAKGSEDRKKKIQNPIMMILIFRKLKKKDWEFKNTLDNLTS